MRPSYSLYLGLLLAFNLAADWPQFRGPNQSSIAESTLPIAWQATDAAWKAPLPGRGVSSPIVVGGKVIVTATSWPKQDRLYVIAVDAKSGKEAWRREFWATGRWFTHPTSANAAPTPASDGKHIYAFFSSNDLACLDLAGNLLWYRGLSHDYPQAGNDVGLASSPLVIGDSVVVQIESQGDSFAAGINKATGETLWRIDRRTEAAWSSPTLFKGKDGRELVLLQSIKYLTAHDPRTGHQIWKYDAECGGIPSSTVVDGKIYVPSKGLTKLEIESATNAPTVLWDSNRLAPGNATPIVHQDMVYTVARAGVLTCAKTENGEQIWQARLKGTFWATPVIANGHLYAANQDGQMQVVKLGGEKGEVVATNEFGEPILGSPAVADNAIYVRSDKHLWKIATP